LSTLYINALPLELGGFGIGSYTRDLILGFGTSAIASRVVLLCPPWLSKHPTVVASGLAVRELGVPGWVPKALRKFVWCEYAGWWLSRQRDAVFFSLAQHASVFAPSNSWVTLHDCMPLRFPVYLGKNPLRSFAYRRALKFLRRCRGIITDSEASREDIVKLCGVSADRVHVVYCWTSCEFTQSRAQDAAQAVRQKYSLPTRYWLYLGGYDVRKNVGLLIQAYATVSRRVNCPPLVLAGKIPTRIHPTLCDVHGDLNKYGLEPPATVLPGFIADEDLPGLYGGAELFVYPSMGEGFGLPPLEAMSCGCPAIVGDNTSLREVVRDDEYRFPTNSPDALQSLLAHAAENPLPLNPSRGSFSLERSMDRLRECLGV
jgi:glycosyltransferase involved in cell wall biosynthesis